MNTDISLQLQEQIQRADKEATQLCIVGGNSKAFYGCTNNQLEAAETLSLAGHQGVLSYEPTELVITARAGTPLHVIEKLLADNGQMLPFEPPAYADTATIGGTIACNFSGPRRAYTGAARDFLLGCKLVNGRGEILSFGGEVMKNVAGYDVSRLMAGAMGTLGVLLEVSLKVLPAPEMESTQLFQCSSIEALDKLHAWSQTPLPISASSFHQSVLRVRLSGADKAVHAAIQTIGGENQADGEHYWQQLKEQQLDFFADAQPLWRISIASDAEVPELTENNCLFEWGGALRWFKSDSNNQNFSDNVQQTAAKFDGHASLFRTDDKMSGHQSCRFQPLTPGLLRIHKNLKRAFDPDNILNPGRLYADI